jgi:hypothetical protein
MNNEFKMSEEAVAHSNHYFGICQEGLRKLTKLVQIFG